MTPPPTLLIVRPLNAIHGFDFQPTRTSMCIDEIIVKFDSVYNDDDDDESVKFFYMTSLSK